MKDNKYKEISLYNYGLTTFKLLVLALILTYGVFKYKIKYILGLFKWLLY